MKEKDILKKVRLLGDRVLIREDESLSEKKTSQGIIIPVTVSNDKGSKQGKVVSVGCGRYEDGERVEIAVKEGDSVLFSWGDKVRIADEELYLVRESEIIAVINK
jgi:chaperonin GroES